MSVFWDLIPYVIFGVALTLLGRHAWLELSGRNRVCKPSKCDTCTRKVSEESPCQACPYYQSEKPPKEPEQEES